MSDDRAERLRNKRNQAREKASQTDEQSETSDSSDTSKPSKPSEESEPDEADESGESESVKDEHVGVYMYLPEDQRDEASYQFDRLKAEYKRETGDELEKNRDFYPLLIQYGLDSLEDWDGSDIQERISEME